MPSRLAVVVAAALACGALLALLLARWWRARRLARRFRRGLAGQVEARALLERRGYQVLAEELEAEGELLVDGERRSFTVRVDYLARRWGRLYGVEVKTGGRAPDPLSIPTRRQLREYAAVLPVDGILLVDMEARALHAVEFPDRRWRAAWLWALLVGLGLGVGATLLLRGLE